MPLVYASFLTAIIFASWWYTLRTAYTMGWERPCDARNLAQHCSKYVIEEEEIKKVELVNAGNALVVSRAEYRGQYVALKRWHGATVSRQHRVLFTKRLIRDIERWRTLQHPNISPVLGVALHISNLPALVVPYTRTVNETLSDVPSTDVLSLLQGVAAGLRYLHSHSPPITHGDLKGSSVFVSAAGTALLSDIGIAAIPQPPDWGFHGVDDARWLAPEVMDPAMRPALAGSDADADAAHTPDATPGVSPESDIYSFAMLAYEMFTRERPFASTTWAAAVIIRVVAGKRPPRPPAAQSPQLCDALWALIQLCWSHDHRARPRIDAVVAWLEVIARTRAVEASFTAAVAGL